MQSYDIKRAETPRSPTRRIGRPRRISDMHLDAIEASHIANDPYEHQFQIDELISAIRSGYGEPDWSKYPKAASAYRIGAWLRGSRGSL